MNTYHEFPCFDEVHVISDIHMGGKPGFQILRETARLAGYIQWVGEQNPAGEVALVLNGDIFDTLAEDLQDKQAYIAIADAIPVLQRIMQDPSFAPIWQALAEFIAKDRRTLVLVIGNHDIELAFPTVQRFIQQQLAQDDLLKRARIIFSTTGAGFSCQVGGARIYCTHGNEVDAWNYNRYEDLARVSRRLNADMPVPPADWQPNAGTRLVKEVMNDIKRQYRWIDLLKPETKAAIGTLAVLDPSQASKITKLVGIVGEKVQGDHEINQRLSFEGFSLPKPESAAPATIEQLLGAKVQASMQTQPVTSGLNVDQLLLSAEKKLGNRDALLDQPTKALGLPELIFDRLTGWITGVGEDEALRKALQDWLYTSDDPDPTFDINNPDDTYTEVMPHIGHAIDFIITGHTHLERAIDIGDGRFYFNCGTWIRLLRFTSAMLQDKASFAPVYQLLKQKNGVITDIDKAEFPDQNGKLTPFVLDQTSAVVIKKEQNQVVGCLLHIEGDGHSQRVIQKFVRA